MEASADKSHHTREPTSTKPPDHSPEVPMRRRSRVASLDHQLLNISEILISIFANCSQSTNAALTRVCRAWSDLALDRLWSSLPSLLPLLRVLLPLVIVDDVLVRIVLIFTWFPHSHPLPTRTLIDRQGPRIGSAFGHWQAEFKDSSTMMV